MRSKRTLLGNNDILDLTSRVSRLYVGKSFRYYPPRHVYRIHSWLSFLWSMDYIIHGYCVWMLVPVKVPVGWIHLCLLIRLSACITCNKKSHLSTSVYSYLLLCLGLNPVPLLLNVHQLNIHLKGTFS